MTFRPAIITALLAGLLSQPTPASAKTPWREVAAANKAAAAGRKAEAQGDFAAALEAYEKSGQHQDTPANRRRLARAKGKLGRLLEAQSELQHVLDDDGASKAHKLKAQQELEELTARIPKLTIKIPTAMDLTIKLDGSVVRPAAAADIPLDPGEHELRAEAPEYEPYQQTLSLKEGESKVVELELIAKPLPQVEEQPVAAPEPTSGSVLTPLGYVSLGVGVVGLALGGYFGLQAKSTRDDLSDSCPTDRCSATERTKFNEGKDQASYSTIGFAVGGAGLVTGALLLMLAPSQQETPESVATLRLQPIVGPGSLWLNGSF